MSKYKVNHPYTAARDGKRFGPWDAGDEVDIEAADAEWVNRDSPGTLVIPEAKATKQESTKPEPANHHERQQLPVRDRQQRGSRNRGD